MKVYKIYIFSNIMLMNKKVTFIGSLICGGEVSF